MSELVFRGVGPALVTPMDAEGRVDMEAFSDHVEHMIAGGVDFLVPCGTTGEGATLTAAEQGDLIRRTVEIAAGRLPVLAGAGSNATSTAVALARGARDAGADGVLMVTPYYNKPTPDGLVRHYRAIAEVGLPIVVYNVPGRTGSNVPPEVILRLAAEVPQVRGVKEAAGSVAQFASLVAERPPGFAVLSGDDELALAEAALGGDGLISVVANEDPAGTTTLFRAAAEGRLDLARREHYRLLPLIRANFLESNPGPVKAALALLGRCEDHLRPPLAPVREETRSRLRAALEAAGLLEGGER